MPVASGGGQLDAGSPFVRWAPTSARRIVAAMPNAPTTPLEICNAALTATGNSPITSFDDGTAEATVAAENYERIVSAEFAYPWTWAAANRRLNRIAGETDSAWTLAYAVPTDMTEVQRVEQAREPVAWERANNKLLTDADDSDTPLIAIGRVRVDEAAWPADFRSGVALRLEALFLRALGEQHKEAAKRDEDAERAIMAARNMDAKRRSNRQPFRSTLIEARRA